MCCFPVTIDAGGASLTQEQIDNYKDCKAIAVNNSYQLAPWADILYACDTQWWEWHKSCPDFKGWKITHEQTKRWEKIEQGINVPRPPYPGIDIIVSNGAEGFSNRQDRIRHGGNGGYQALHIAMLLGAKTIYLLGYDMHARGDKSHWHGEHPTGRQRDGRYIEWIRKFDALAVAAKERGQHIVNCTPDSALKCFENDDLTIF
jgi:hypothetical protein